MTELDLQDLGIWWIPIGWSAADRQRSINAWAIQDGDLGFTLFDCGLDTDQSLAEVSAGLAAAGATLRDVRRVILSHAHPEHAGGLRRVLARAATNVEIFASEPEARRLGLRVDRAHAIVDGDLFQFRHCEARALRMPGHSPGLVCLDVSRAGVFLSSDLLIHEFARIAPAVSDRERFGASLERLYGMNVTVVLPGRGSPFGGHRRVVREAVESLGPRAPRRAEPEDARGTLTAERQCSR